MPCCLKVLKRSSCLNVFMVLLMLSIAPFLKASEGPGEKEQLLALDQQVLEAFITADVAFLKQVLADDFMWVHAGAYRIDDKQAALEGVAARTFTYLGCQQSDVKIQQYEDAAILSGYLTVQTNIPDFAEATFHVQKVYVRVKGRWHMATQHSILVRDKKRKMEEG